MGFNAKAKMSFDVEMRVTEAEARALEVILSYSPKDFLRVFKTYLGTEYIGPQEEGLTALFARRTELANELRRIDATRRAFDTGV